MATVDLEVGDPTRESWFNIYAGRYFYSEFALVSETTEVFFNA